mmetsp:Transcript_29471/g.44704  ORF Transcript_29471/g.44704 Transcript_29471/m.44704 type:complete len:227 (-) Transcript_29471:36-716(-)|eukprot:CAMPEP_0170492876 /NCGR_PEP_ID=MMETSP0208-20121228/13014_1 /TAXON_ID=197538 /ORGANISM="Strombidium inclinatum, Strain S3" /LENGTH=226 /DNA_ID=CAMNT_0010768705 /DNA_START=231 /DNA_END=911 /DNA_ORIENTATION=-
MGFLQKIFALALKDHQGGPIVTYDSSERQVYGYRAGWLMRALKAVSPATEILILDGGFQKWQKENLPTSSCSPKDLHSITMLGEEHPDHQEFNAERIKFLGEMQAFEKSSIAGQPKFHLLDARPQEDVDQGTVKGQRTFTFTKFFDVDGDVITLKPKAERKKMLTEFKLTPEGAASKELVVMCRTGVTATVLLGALSDLYLEMGFSHLSLYDGSWLEFQMDPLNKL